MPAHTRATHTHKQEQPRHRSTQRSRTKESGVFESEKGWLQWAEMKRLHPVHLKREEMRIKRQSSRKGKESPTILLPVNNTTFIHTVAFLARNVYPASNLDTSVLLQSFLCCFSLKHNLILPKLIKCPYCCSFDPIDLVFG